MDSFLRQTAQAILAKTQWQDLNRTTLVLPSHRAGLALKEELLRLQQEQHRSAVWAPSVQTLTQLQDAFSPLYAEDELFTIVRLYKLYLGLGQDDAMPLDLFYGWGRQMLADFTNIDASMEAQEVPNFFANTVAAHALGQWKLDEETEQRLRQLVNGTAPTTIPPQSIRAQYEVLWQHLYSLYTSLRAELAAEQKGYAGMRQRAVLEHWDDESVQAQRRGRMFIFVGFNYLLPVERDLMMRLKEAKQAMFFWDFVPDFHTNEKAFSFAQRNSALLGNDGLTSEGVNELTNERAVTLVECASREAQAQYVHRWLQENYTAQGQRVGVVICDETMLEPVIYTLPAITLPGETEPAPVNITKGFPLRNTAAYARTMAWLNDRARGDAEQLITPDFIGQMLSAITTNEEDLSPLTDNLSPLKWQELLILESEYQVRKIANQLRALLADGLGVPFTLRLLRLLMRRMMESVSMPFHGEPVTDIQVMGVLETRLLDFDRLLMLNVEEGVIPQQQKDASFIPYYLRKVYHMQTSDEKATIYAYNFFRLLHRAGQATLLYASAETADGAKGMSRFIMQMRYSDAFTIRQQTLEEPAVLSPLSASMSPVTASLSSILTVQDGVLMRANGKRYTLSPSALNTFISCPLAFYRQYIQGLRPVEKEDLFFAPNTLGSFVHRAMEYLYRTYLHCDNSQPVPVTPEHITALMDEAHLQEALEAAYRAMNDQWLEDHPDEPDHYQPEHHFRENMVIKTYVTNILERDCEDAKKGLQICMLEQPCWFPVTIDGVGELLTGGVVDRIDWFGAPGQETIRVVDYKSGSYNDTTHAKKMSSSWEELMTSDQKDYVRQTLVYSHAVMERDTSSKRIEPHLYFSRRKLTDITTTIEVEGLPVADYRQIEKPFFKALRTKIAELFRTTEFPPCAPDHCSPFCPFLEMCGRPTPE